MFLSGIADEAGRAIENQIAAHRTLGWGHIELRTVEGEGIALMDDARFDAVYGAVTGAGLAVSCFASAIANWARPITADFQADVDELRRAAPRMRRLGTRFIRIMSYPNDPKQPLPETAWRAEAIRRVRELTRIAEDEEIVLAHENCSGWGGLSPEANLELLDEVASPALQVLFDTGNPVSYGQDAWAYYQAVADRVAYVHIKDAELVEGGHTRYTYPGEGHGCVREVVTDLLARGYDGGFSIEPHLKAIIHEGQQADEADALYAAYVEYGRRLTALVEEVRAAR